MNEWNNFNTLELYKGGIWIKKHNSKENKGLNIYYYDYPKKDFIAIAYIIKNEKRYTYSHNQYYNLDEIINVILKNSVTEYMLNDEELTLATCGFMF